MQLLFAITTLLLSINCVSCLIHPNLIECIFNNGVAPSNSSGCSDTEMLKVDRLFDLEYRRYLRDTSKSIMKDMSLASVRERDLTFGRNCAAVCSGYAPGTCKKIGCMGFEVTEQFVPPTCSEELYILTTKLNNIQNNVTERCKNFLDESKRILSCDADVDDGNIEGMRVWKFVDSATSIPIERFAPPGGNATVCVNTKMNIESLNQPSVTRAKLLLTGPNNYRREQTEGVAPFALFGDSNGKFYGGSLSTTGTYTLAITPNTNTTKTKTFTILAVSC